MSGAPIVPETDEAARAELEEGDPVARVLEFARLDTGAMLRDADARIAARTPEERRQHAAAVYRNRRQAARLLIGPQAPEWLVDLVARRGSGLITGEDGKLLRDANRIAFGEARAAVIERLATYLFDHGISKLMTLSLLCAWATSSRHPFRTKRRSCSFSPTSSKREKRARRSGAAHECALR